MGVSEEQIEQEVKRRNSQQQMQNEFAGNVSSDRENSFSEKILSIEEQQELNTLEQDLEQIVFGREIFTNKNLSFEPDLNIPTPKDYRLAAGDELLISVWGDAEMNFNQTISPDGTIFIPNLGPISLSGLTVEGAENRIKIDLGRIISSIDQGEKTNTYVSVSLGKIRSLKINIVGGEWNSREPIRCLLLQLCLMPCMQPEV
ncbi:MAG: polysaccharide biosynthesis/export family protein [Tannerellaceae bacterium]|nr:polysaccharide biosynthesis/export family protein [Tannerellaceae bacterium]